nr:ABC transporter substrate-binding protein [uncultured Anaerotignum sp.]
MKKTMGLLAMAMAAVMAMTGCGGNQDAADGDTDKKVYHVGIIQQMEHGSLDAATKGFQDKLTELLGEENVSFDYQNAQGEQANCTTISTKLVSDGCDLIMANATTALQTAAAATSDIPIVGTSVTDYVTAGVVDSNEAPGKNVTGVSDLASIEKQIDVLLQFCDKENVKVAIVYCSAEPNSKYQVDLATKYLDEQGIPYQTYTAADSNEIQAVVTKAVADCNAMYIPTDNTLANNMEIVKNIAVPARVPTVTGAEAMCEVGGLATLSISYYDLGAKAAEMAYDILVNGKKPAEMPIEYLTDGLVPKYNPDIAEALGVTIPEGMEPVA